MSWTELCLIVAGLYLAIRLRRAMGPRIDPVETAAALDSGTAVLIDVREPGEWADGVAERATLLALSDLQGSRKYWTPFLEKNRQRRLLLYCRSGARSAHAAAKLRREGFNAVNAGTLHGWRRLGWKTVPPTRP